VVEEEVQLEIVASYFQRDPAADKRESDAELYQELA
jgi:hypothetical protein